MQDSSRTPLRVFGLAVALTAMLVTPLLAQQAPEKLPEVADKAFRAPGLDIQAVYNTPGELPAQAAAQARARLQALGADNGVARVDRRSGRFITLAPATPVVPGNGVGNGLRWDDLGVPAEKAAGPVGLKLREKAALQAFRGYLDAHADELQIDLAELSDDQKITSHENGRVFQVYMPRSFDGIPVRGSYLTAVINNGNVNLMGLELWGDRAPGKAGRPQLDLDQARQQAEGYLSPLDVTREWGKPQQVWIPTARGNAPAEVQLRQGYDYSLAWAFKYELAEDGGSWEVLVDAHTGDILAAEDKNEYVEATGGVLPVTNDGVSPDGVEQAGWPMPYMFVGGETTDAGGNYTNTGSVTANLDGSFIRMNDNCGSISLTQSGGIDFGTSGGTDCTTPGFGGAGNTHASRTGFYELNKMVEMAQGQLPTNSWLQQQMTSNMNINSTCNAFWNGSTVNFYRSGGGCANTGEIAGVFDHEWGHGMDDNDANPSIASPSGEGIADMYTALRLDTSCIGRNFRPGQVCGGFGDPCLTCTGVRDIDYLKRQSGQPHDYTWANANCGSSVHCLGGTYSEAMWSLWKRILTAAPYGYDNDTAQEITTRLTFIGGGNVGTWFSGGPPYGGCGSSGGYLQFLAADDDNGNINDGTPHMQAIFQAFDDQEIACNSPTVQDSGCSGTPTAAPNVTATAGNQSVSLSWGSVSGASEYEIYRTEGVFQCDFGKTKVGSTTGTSFNDSGLQNGRDYSYVVIPKGSSDACFGPASACDTVAPSAAPDFTVACTPTSQSIQQNGSGNATCTVSSLGGYTGNVGLSCSGNPGGVGCSFSPSSVSPPSNGSANSTLTLSVTSGQSTGTFNFNVVGNDGSTSKSTGIEVTVTPEGQNGPQDAVYDSGLGAPACATPGTECDSVALLDGRAGLGPEPNASNTLDTCTDGTSGTYHSDESNDRIVVRSLDGFDFSEGATVEVEATVWAWNTGSSDTVDLYYAADANNPSWTLIGSLSPSAGGANTLSTTYTLPNGALQAVRANFRYQGTQSPCSGGSYDDADDLVFAVNTAGNTAPSVNITAPANGATFTEGDSISFSGTASDNEDGTISASLSWTSSIDGSIGSGASFSTSTLSAGSHTITASVTDSGGLNGSDSIGITVNAPTNNAPTVNITAPTNGSSFDEGTSVSFSGTASDTEDGDLTGSLSWSSSLDGSIGSGGSFSTSTLSAGTHTITASVTDSGGLNGSDSISVTINTVGGGNCNGTNCIDWDVTTTTSFATQDSAANFQVQDGGDTMYLLDNTWRRTTTTFNVTANTVVEFEFSSSTQGEIHGIGFDEDNTLSSNRIFKVHGTQGYGIQDFDNYAGGTVTYTIPVGQYFTGSAMNMVLVNDNDAGSGNDSTFTNVRVYEDVATCTVNDDFESGTATGWVNDAASTCTTGAYTLGDPTNPSGGYQVVGSNSGVYSIFTAVNTSAGADDVDGGNCILTSPSWTVSNASTLSVAYWHGQRDAGDDASGDFFLLEYSTNGGSSWNTLASNGDSTSNPAWLQATTSVPAGSNVQLRVQCSDGTAGGDLVECGIDDVSICD